MLIAVTIADNPAVQRLGLALVARYRGDARHVELESGPHVVFGRRKVAA